jgi:hypothetical protein
MPQTHFKTITLVTQPNDAITRRLSIENLRNTEVSHLSLTITHQPPYWEESYSYDDWLAVLDAFPALEKLSITGHYPTLEIPSHILKKLNYLTIFNESSVQLEIEWESLNQLEELHLNIPVTSPGVEQLLSALPGMKTLRHFRIPKTSNLELWRQLLKAPAVETLDLSHYKVLPASVPAIIELVKPLSHLKEITHFYPKKNEELPEELIQLDFLERLELLPTLFKDSTNLPVVLSRLKKVHLCNEWDRNRVSYTLVNTFIQRYAMRQLTDRQREILFLCWTKSWHRVKAFTRNHLLENRESQTPIVLAGTDKLPSLNKTALKSKLQNTPFTLADKNARQTIWVLHNKSVWEEAENAILNEIPFVTEEHLTEYLHALETPYLLEADNQALTENVLRLLISEEENNLLVAFEMIQSGGATVAIQSMIAALALQHSSDVIRKKARQVYAKVGNPAFVPLFRKSFYKYTDYAFRLSKHEAISETDFMAMIDYLAYVANKQYHNNSIASRFTLYWQRLGFRTITANLPYFSDIHRVFFDQNPDMDVVQVLDILAQLPDLNELGLSGCKLHVPVSITRLQALKTLNLASCQMDDFSALGQMKKLQELYLAGCKVKDWSWVSELPALKLINVSKADESKIPHLRKEMAGGKPFLRLRE